MIARVLRWLLPLPILLGLIPDPAAAQQMASPARDAAVPTPPAAEDIDRLIGVLDDPVARAQLIESLRTLRDAAAASGPQPSEALADASSIAQGLIEIMDARLRALSQALGAMVAAAQELPALTVWLKAQVSADYRRAFWQDALGRLGLLLGVGTIAYQLVRTGLLPWMRRLDQLPATTTAARLRLGAMRLGLMLLPPASFALATSLALAGLAPNPVLRAAAQSIVLAFLLGRLVNAAAQVLLSPRNAEQRLILVDDAAAAPLASGTRWLAGAFIWGHLAIEAMRVLGLPPELARALQHLVNLGCMATLITVLWRHSDAVAGWIGAIQEGERGLIGRIVPWRAVASGWHVAATLWLLLLYVIWAIDVPGGVTFLAVGTLGTFLALGFDRVATALIAERLAPPPPPPVDIEGGPGPAPAEADGRYRPIVRFGLTWLTHGLAAILLLESWGVAVIEAMRGETGQTLLSTLVRVGMIGLISFAAWELVSLGIGRYLAARDGDGNLALSNRTRTILTITRNVLLVLIALIGGMLGLSAIGVDTAPLLAGAGVIGLAVGFGSQRLVQDIITGMFILLGDTMRVGDVVNLGGASGVVESMTMRTVSLRAYDGSVHTLPYSAIAGITNFTKDFSYWVVEAAVGYDSNLDEVITILRQIVDQMRQQWPWRRHILEPLDVAGVDRFGDSAIVIKARIKTRPGQQWEVGREFNRRMKQRFDAAGITIPFPQRTVHMVPAQAPAAPAAPAASAPAAPRAPATNPAGG